jgi:Ion channel
MRLLVGTVSVLLMMLTLYEVFEVMLLPRRVRRRLRFVRAFFDGTWRTWRALARRMPVGERRETFLSFYGPLSLILLLALWGAGLIFEFGAIEWALAQGHPDPLTFGISLYMSGTTFLTLGYGDFVPVTTAGRWVSVIEAGTGFGLIAVIIGYLPVLYQLFAQREAHVVRLDARAGSPPSATTLLVRHAVGERLDALDAMFMEWEVWSAELLESHLSYPMLAYYRSQHENESWLAALTAVMDACALVMVGFRGVNTFQARTTFGTARLAVLEMARVFDATRITGATERVRLTRLPSDEFMKVRDALAAAGLEFHGDDAARAGAEAELAEFRALYEPFVATLAAHLLLPLPPWAPPPNALDNWQRSKGSAALKRLVDSVEAKPE